MPPNKITGANSHPASQLESRAHRRRAPVVESRGHYNGGAAVAQFWHCAGGKIGVKIPCKTHGIAHGTRMKTITATSARTDLYRVIDSTLADHEPVQITGKRGNAVLVAEADWRAIQETLYLVSIPGMRESIRQGMEEPITNCSREIDL